MNMFREGAGFLAQQMMLAASDPVVYSRGPISVTVQASRGSTPFESEQRDGSVIRYEASDFIIVAALLQMLGEPQYGDLINDGSNTFEVLSPSGSPPFRYSDPFKTIFRVHTKQVS